MFPVGASIDIERFLAGEYSYKHIFSFADEHAKGDDIIQLPSCRAVVSVVRDSDGDIRDHYRAIAEYLKKENLIPCSDVYSLSIVNVIDPHEERKYLKLKYDINNLYAEYVRKKNEYNILLKESHEKVKYNRDKINRQNYIIKKNDDKINNIQKLIDYEQNNKKENH